MARGGHRPAAAARELIGNAATTAARRATTAGLRHALPMSQAKSFPDGTDESLIDGGQQETDDDEVPTAPADPTDPPVDPEEPVNPA
jgi:hypothetical protein